MDFVIAFVISPCIEKMNYEYFSILHIEMVDFNGFSQTAVT